MLNSANYMSDKEVINSGEVISPEYDLKDPNVKVYYHQVAGAKTHLPDGAEIQFTGGQFATANAEIKAYLDKIADKRGTMVFTKKTVGVNPDMALAASSAAEPAGVSSKMENALSPEVMNAVKINPDIAAKMAKPEAPDILPGQDVKAILKAGVVPFSK